MNTKKLIVLLVVVASVAGNMFLGFKYAALQNQLLRVQSVAQVRATNEKVLEFSKLFVEKVLNAESEVDFETRLRLETVVRDTKDAEIVEQWQRFVESETEIAAQLEVKRLLALLVNKIR